MDKYELLLKYYGYSDFRYPQGQMIDDIVEGKDVIGILRTGFGKSLVFQIAAYLKDGMTIVICPLMSLMENQVDNLKKRNISAEFINSSLDRITVLKIYKLLMDKKIKILYVTPERIQRNDFLEIISNQNISTFVFDEAHTIMWGYDFRKSFLAIKIFLNKLKSKPSIVALTATATNDVIEKIKDELQITSPSIYFSSVERKSLFYRIIKPKNPYITLLNIINTNKDELIIIYFKTIRELNSIREKLKIDGYETLSYHGEMESIEKKSNLMKFIKMRIKIMCATVSFGMGIDISNIRMVINYGLPLSMSDLVQMAGRAGRDGVLSTHILISKADDIQIANALISGKSQSKKYFVDFKKVIEYSNYKKCLHKYIANLFGNIIQDCRDRCLNCTNKLKQK